MYIYTIMLIYSTRMSEIILALYGKQCKSERLDSCDRINNLTQIEFNSSIFQPVWPWNLMDDLEK